MTSIASGEVLYGILTTKIGFGFGLYKAIIIFFGLF
jgi:hypothetical protein